jgi:putative addiction module killer protein
MGKLEYIASVVRFRRVAIRTGRPKSEGQILARPRSATFGNFGDCEPVGEGVSEMRIHVGAGHRVYYTRTGSTVYALLAGGVKASQTKDIARAKTMARELKRAKP